MSVPVFEFVVEEYLHSKRIETFLSRHLRNHTTYRIQQMVREQCVWINDCLATIESRVKLGNTVRIALTCPPDKIADAEDLPLDILYEDKWILVVNKPAGQIAHPVGAFSLGSLEAALQHHVNSQSLHKGMVRPGIVHRLDRQTSGLMVIPKDHVSHRDLTNQFTVRSVKKTYIALLEGVLPDDSGWIHLPIGDVPNPTCRLVCAKSFAIHAKVATTRFRVLERFADHTFVEASPTTGRHHQIRVHFAELGFPLVADEFYTKFGCIKDGTALQDPARCTQAEIEKEIRLIDPFYDPTLPIRRHALHAAQLSFDHPVSRQRLAFRISCPSDFSATLQCLRDRPANGSA
jgi:23S rRNA pseudouridine1911/1915/1917 synthase